MKNINEIVATLNNNVQEIMDREEYVEDVDALIENTYLAYPGARLVTETVVRAFHPVSGAELWEVVLESDDHSEVAETSDDDQNPENLETSDEYEWMECDCASDDDCECVDLDDDVVTAETQEVAETSDDDQNPENLESTEPAETDDQGVEDSDQSETFGIQETYAAVLDVFREELAA